MLASESSGGGVGAFRNCVLILLGCFLAVWGTGFGSQYAENSVVTLFFVVLFVFLVLCLGYYISNVITSKLLKSNIRKKVAAKLYIFFALFGALIVALDLYFFIFRGPLCVLVFALLLVIGILIGRKREEEKVIFRTYDDLLALKPKTAEEAEEGEDEAKETSAQAK